MPPSPIDVLLPELIHRVITFLLVVGLTATALSPHRPAWRILPFTNQSAQELSYALRRLMAVGLTVDFIYVALTRSGGETDALVGGRRPGAGHRRLAVHPAGARPTAPGMRRQPEGAERSSMIGGTWWSIARLLLSVAVLSSILFALLGYATLAAQLHNAIYITCLLIAVALLAASPDRRPARGGGGARHAVGQVGAPSPRPAGRCDPARPAPGDAAGRPRPAGAARRPHSGRLGRRHRRHPERRRPADPRRAGRRRHHLARQYRHGDRGLRRLHPAGAPDPQHRARPRAADRRRADAAAPVDRRRAELYRRDRGAS